MTSRIKFAQHANAKIARQERRSSDSVVVTGTATGTVVVQRDTTSGRFTTARSSTAIDKTTDRFEDALRRLAKK